MSNTPGVVDRKVKDPEVRSTEGEATDPGVAVPPESGDTQDKDQPASDELTRTDIHQAVGTAVAETRRKIDLHSRENPTITLLCQKQPKLRDTLKKIKGFRKENGKNGSNAPLPETLSKRLTGFVHRHNKDADETTKRQYLDALTKLRTKKKQIFVPEIRLALCSDPLTEDVHNIAIFSPYTDLDENENFNIIISETLIDQGIPEELHQVLTLFLIKQLKYNLAQLRKYKKEIVTQDDEMITLNDLYETVGEVEHIGNEPITLQAERLIQEVQKIKEIPRKNGSIISKIENEEGLPGADFADNRKEVTKALLVFLHKSKIIDLNEITAEQLIKVINRMAQSADDAVKFLRRGEKYFTEMQRKFLDETDAETPHKLDELDLLEQLKNFNFYELLHYGKDTQHQINWRVQANNLAYIRYKLMLIELSEHYINAPTTANKIRDTMTDFDVQKGRIWRTLKDTTTDPASIDYELYSTRTGDKSTEPQENSEFLEGVSCRKWISPISGKEYHIKLEDGLIKDASSILIKAILKSSEGDPENLYDLVRQTLVFANNVNTNDPVVKKDIYYFMYLFGIRSGMKPASTQIGTDDWEKLSPEEIFEKFQTRKEMKERRESEKKNGGYFTIEDKKINGTPNALSNQEDVKLVGRDEETGVGIEIQALTLKEFTRAQSLNTKESHKNYEYRRMLDVMLTIYPAHLFPDTYYTIALIKVGMEIAEIKYEKKKIEKLLNSLPEGQDEDEKRTIAEHFATPLQSEIESLDAKLVQLKHRNMEVKKRKETCDRRIQALQSTTSNHLAVGRSK